MPKYYRLLKLKSAILNVWCMGGIALLVGFIAQLLLCDLEYMVLLALVLVVLIMVCMVSLLFAIWFLITGDI